MTLLKTTQSGFEGFFKDRFTTLQETKDRCFCTSVYSRWRYNKIQNVDFDNAWYAWTRRVSVRHSRLKIKGLSSQEMCKSYDCGEICWPLRSRRVLTKRAKNALWLASSNSAKSSRSMLTFKITQIKTSVKRTNVSLKVEEIEIVMPNQHYFVIDMTKMGIVNKNEVCSCHRHSFWNCGFVTCFTHIFALAGSSSTGQPLRQHHWNTVQEAAGQAVNETLLWPM